jgi:hypothetical protein
MDFSGYTKGLLEFRDLCILLYSFVFFYIAYEEWFEFGHFIRLGLFGE